MQNLFLKTLILVHCHSINKIMKTDRKVISFFILNDSTRPACFDVSNALIRKHEKKIIKAQSTCIKGTKIIGKKNEDKKK